jgi:hypothetical protein
VLVYRTCNRFISFYVSPAVKSSRPLLSVSSGAAFGWSQTIISAVPSFSGSLIRCFKHKPGNNPAARGTGTSAAWTIGLDCLPNSKRRIPAMLCARCHRPHALSRTRCRTCSRRLPLWYAKATVVTAVGTVVLLAVTGRLFH